MFIYVFDEPACDAMMQAGFSFVCESSGAKAWVFLAEEGREIPEGIEKVVTSVLTFDAEKEKQKNGGTGNGTTDDAPF